MFDAPYSKPNSYVVVISSTEERNYSIGNIKKQNDWLLQNISVLAVPMPKLLDHLFEGKSYSISLLTFYVVLALTIHGINTSVYHLIIHFLL